MEKNGFLLHMDMMEYGEAWGLQKTLLEARISGKTEDCFILLQHPPTFTFGRRYKEYNLIVNRDYYERKGFAVYKTDRGGLATYHGPGQVVGYPIVKMGNYTNDYYLYLRMLEEIMIRTLGDFGIDAKRNEGFTGVWVENAKVGFVGVRITLGYTMHGFSLNVNNELSPFNYITPCGIHGMGVTSVRKLLNKTVEMKNVCDALADHYSEVFCVHMIPVGINAMYQMLGLVDNACNDEARTLISV